MHSETPDPRVLEFLVADLRAAAGNLQRELEEHKASVPTPGDCRTASDEALYALGCAVLRTRRVERAPVVARELAEACRREVSDLRGLYDAEQNLVAYWSGVHAAATAAVVPLGPHEPAADVLARVGRAMVSDPAHPALAEDRT